MALFRCIKRRILPSFVLPIHTRTLADRVETESDHCQAKSGNIRQKTPIGIP